MLNINFHPFTILETTRLILRRIVDSDAPALFQLRGNPETMKYVFRPLVTTVNEALELIQMMNEKIEQNEGINWAITLKNDDTLIGFIGIYRINTEHHRAEIGYMLLQDFCNKGITTEAIDAVLNYGFNNLQLHSMEAIIDPRNTASEKVLQKNGFVKEAHFIENECYNNVFLDTVVYSLLKRNYGQ